MKRWAKQTYKEVLFRLSASNSWLFHYYYRYLYRPRQGSLDHFLDQFSKSYQPITVIQVGANDGITHDPIHKFIKRDQWQGVLLEPQRDVFEKYLSKIYLRNPKIKTINAALGKNDGHQSIFKIAFSEARWATGLTSFRRDVIEKAFKSGHVHRQAAKEGISVPKDPSQWIIENAVEVWSVRRLLEDHQIKHIDLLQIDTEGYDYEIIKLFDLEYHAPRVIIYENIHLSTANQEACEAHLKKAGYQVKMFSGNTLAMQNPSKLLWSFFTC